MLAACFSVGWVINFNSFHQKMLDYYSKLKVTLMKMAHIYRKDNDVVLVCSYVLINKSTVVL